MQKRESKSTLLCCVFAPVSQKALGCDHHNPPRSVGAPMSGFIFELAEDAPGA
jgi:hypothetical protein